MLESNHLYVGAKHATEDKARHPSDVAFPTAADIGREVAKALLVRPSPIRLLSFSGRLDVAVSPGSPLLGGSGRIVGLYLQSGAISLTASARATTQFKFTDGNFNTIATPQYDVLNGAAAAVGGNTPVLQYYNRNIPFENGLNLEIDVLNAGYAAASYYWGQIWYESIAIGERPQC